MIAVPRLQISDQQVARAVPRNHANLNLRPDGRKLQSTIAIVKTVCAKERLPSFALHPIYSKRTAYLLLVSSIDKCYILTGELHLGRSLGSPPPPLELTSGVCLRLRYQSLQI